MHTQKHLTNHATSGLSEAVQRHGWPRGLEVFVANLPDCEARAIRSEIDLRHTCWKGLLDPRQRKDALVIDPGLGTVAVSLARDFARVHAFYDDAGLMAAVEARARWLQIHNISFIVRPDLFSLQFPQNSLDAIVLYGLSDSDLPDTFLQKCAAWLRPQGAVFIMLRNNPGLLPNLFNRKRPGFTAIRRHLRPCFPRVTCFWYESDFIEPNELLALDGMKKSFRTRLMSALTAFRATSFGLLASKAERPHSVFQEITRAIEKAQFGKRGKDFSVSVQRQFFAFPVGFTLITAPQGDGRKLIVRIPFDDRTLTRYRKNHETLKLLAQLAIFEEGIIPEPLLAGEALNQWFFVESAVDGKPVTTHMLRNSAQSSKITAEAISWITKLHRATVKPHYLDDSLVERLILAPLRRARAQGSRGPLAYEYETLEEFLVRRLAGRTINLVCLHGDYSVDNVLVDAASSEIKGVFDWDLSEERGLPLLDAFYFLVTADALREDFPVAKVLTRKLFPLHFTASDRVALDKYCEALRVPKDLVFPLALLTWVHHIACRLENPELYQYHFPYWSSDLVDGVLKAVVRLINERNNCGLRDFGC